MNVINSKKKLGILGGMGPLATVDLLEKIISHTDANKDNEHIRIFIDNNPSIPDRTDAIIHGNESPLPAMKESVKILEDCGAECIIVPCNTSHYFLPELKKVTSIPFIDMISVTADSCLKKFPRKKAAILSTKGTLYSGLYQRALQERSISFLEPNEDENSLIMDMIYKCIKAGNFSKKMYRNFEVILNGMKDRGADYYILGCTELPIVFRKLNSDVLYIDPTTELAISAIQFCGYNVKP